MNFRDVGLVAAKELRETLRDRRTLMVMVLFPLVVYPLVSLLMAQVMASRITRGESRPSRVVVLGPRDAAQAVRARLTQDPKSFTVRPGAAAAGAAEIESDVVDAVVHASPGAGGVTDVRVVYDETREGSSRARDRIATTLGNVMPAACTSAFKLDIHSIAPRARVGGYVLSKILPLVVVVMVMLGAFYPAIDITAGERERGTLETILSAPIARFDLMTGKVLAVATLAAVSGILNMASMSLTMLEGIHLIGVGASAQLSIPWTRAAATVVVVLPTAFLFASVMVAIGSMARSFKEAQTLLTPVYFLCFTPSLVAGLGDFELTGATMVVPGVNVTLLARDLVLGKATAAAIAAVVVSTLAYGAMALALAARLYDSERLLAADEPNLPLGAWLRRLLAGSRQPGAAGPNPAQSLALYGIAFILLFVFISLRGSRLEPALLLFQWGGLLGLVVLYARGTGQTIAAAIGLSRPSARALAGAVLIGVSASLVVSLPAQWLFPAPDEVMEKLRKVVAPADGSRGLVSTLLLMALTPAICEEALFRGPILRGFATRFSPLAASVLTGVLFGLYHVNLWQLVPTTVLGVVLSLIALRSGSILPAMLTHFINNAGLVTLAHLGGDRAAEHLRRPVQIALFVGATLVAISGSLLIRGARAR